jgi:hypothetical protein
LGLGVMARARARARVRARVSVRVSVRVRGEHHGCMFEARCSCCTEDQ